MDQANCWKKEIGIANRNHLKLTEKLQLLENDDITNQAEGNFHTKDQAEVITVNSVDNVVPQPTNLIGTCSICSLQIYDYSVEYFNMLRILTNYRQPTLGPFCRTSN